MRRFICISMIILFLLTVITGFTESHVHPGQSGIHTPLAILFIFSVVAHGLINRKSLARHFMGTPQKERKAE